MYSRVPHACKFAVLFTLKNGDLIMTITPQENRLSVYLKCLAVFYTFATIGYLIPGIVNLPESFDAYRFLTDPAYVNNSTVKISLFAFLSFFAAANIWKYREMIVVIILASIVAEIASITLVLFAKNNYAINPTTFPTSVTEILVVSIVFDGLIAGLLWWFFVAAERARLKLEYFTPMQFRALKSIAEVVINGDGKTIISDEEIAYNVDRYMAGFRARSKWISKVVMTAMYVYPLLSFNPPIPYMSRENRLAYLKKRFYRDVSLALTPKFIRTFLSAMIRMSKQLVYMGYYNDSRVHPSIGYVPFSQRPDSALRLQNDPPAPRKELKTLSESQITGDEFSAEVCIVGSGAAASILANEFVKKGKHVVMVERGEHYDRSTFNEDEIDMVSRLYADGALQTASDFKFQVFQGSCVGGSTVVNNAVCFDLPEAKLDQWNDERGLNAGLDKNTVKNSMQYVNTLMGVKPAPYNAVRDYLNPGGKLFLEGIKKLGLDSLPSSFGSVAANIEKCVGCGYCNLGCPFGKKLSMLDHVLPDAQKNGPGKLEIITGCEAIKFEGNGSKITDVLGEFRSGRKIRIKAEKFILSAGAISSSIVLLRSGISKNAGKRVCFNIGSQITAAFPQVINSHEGLQISHYLNIAPSRGFIVETWFNPPMFQSTATPGWFEDHCRNMQRYNKMTCGGVLVGSESNAEVRFAGLTGRDIRYTPTKSDFDKLIEGVKLAGNVFLAAGAESVIPNTFTYREYKTSAELDRLGVDAKDTQELGIGTGHPQGGNVIGKDPNVSVIGPDFKVHGYDNLHVCDASVFPSSAGVNPQITVMTLAHYASQII
jgi:choline dehydrogenase-like flavoprotein